MKAFIFVAAVAAVFGIVMCGDHDHSEELKKVEDDCVKETGVDLDILTKAENGEFVDGDNLKGFPKCFFLKVKFMKENGELDESVIVDHAEKLDEKEKRLPMVQECIKKTGVDADDTAYQIYRCYYEGVKKLGLKP